MERNKTQFSRLMALDAAIREGSYPNCLSFSADWEVSQKTVQRDIDYLRDQLQAPIEYDRKQKGFYYSDENWFLPSVSLSEGELTSLLLSSVALESYRGTPIAKDLEGLFTKLLGSLPDKITVKPELIYSQFSFTTPPSKPIDQDVWVVLVRGLLNRRSITISYKGYKDKATANRKVDPYHIANLAGEWYLFAYCHKSDRVRQFSIPRISKAEVLKQSFEVSKDFDAKDWLSGTFGRFAAGGEELQKVRLLFNTEIADWVLERQWHPHQKIVKKKGGDIELSFKAGGLLEVFRWVMAWGRYCQALEPKELVEWIDDEVKEMNKKRRRTK